MANYYKTNIIYDSLLDNGDFIWVSGNAWSLIYGDKQSIPKLIAFVYGTSWNIQENIIIFSKSLSRKTKLPVCFIEFDDDEDNYIEKVRISYDFEKFDILTLDELKEVFKTNGLNIDNKPCSKYLNDKTSSAYHTWQRNSLGYNITVSDIDLIRMHNNKHIEIIELKRSFKNVSIWSPYSDDFANFNLLYNLAIKANFCFTIAYNQRITKPMFNDIKEPLSIFEFKINSANKIADNISFDDFKKGIYHIYFTSDMKKYVDVPFCNIEIQDLRTLSSLNTCYKEKAINELRRRNAI